MIKTISNINLLTNVDFFNLILFALYKLSKDENYSTLSLLAYTLDKDNFLKLVETFGGTTIKIPTKQELSLIVTTLILYQKLNLEQKEINEVLKDLDLKNISIASLLSLYEELNNLLDIKIDENKLELLKNYLNKFNAQLSSLEYKTLEDRVEERLDKCLNTYMDNLKEGQKQLESRSATALSKHVNAKSKRDEKGD